MIGAAGDSDGGEAGADEGGRGGLNGQGGKANIAGEGGMAGVPETGDDAGSAGIGGEASVETELEITKPNLAAGKTYVPFTGKITARGAAHYDWKLTGGVLPMGLTLQGTQSDTVTLAGTPTEAGEFPLGFSVTDGTVTKTIDVALAITHSALFLSDRNTSGVNELFLTEIGGATAATPVRLSASIPTGGNITNYAWSPDGSKVMYLATQSSGGTSELWAASLASPGSAQRVSAQGISVTQMAWLGSGHVAAYATGGADAYLVDLAGTAPGTSKLAIAASTVSNNSGLGISPIKPSPNGTSVAFLYYIPMLGAVYAYSYATWDGGAAKSQLWSAGASDFAGYSHDGRFVAMTDSGVGRWLDLSLASPTPNVLGPSFSGAWSPSSNLLLYVGSAAENAPSTLRLGTFDGGTFSSKPLASSIDSNGSYARPWSPDGKNGLFSSGRDLRSITNVATATDGTDFSLLPSSFLPNTFTDLQNMSWSPDSTWIVLSTDRDVDKQNDLYLIRYSAPGTAYKAHNNSIAQGVSTYSFAPNSHSVAFVGTISPQPNAGLYVTKLPSSGAPPPATLASAPANAIVQSDINWAPGSRVLTYRASVSNTTQLFALPVAADGTAGTPISVSGVSGSGVASYQLAPTH